MGVSALALYVLTVLVWGSTWLAIKFQLGEVEPLVSVIYRFGLASALLFVWCRWRAVALTLTAREHGFMMLQGSCLFGFNYWLIYRAELYLTSGVVAVIFSFIVFFNVLNARLFLGTLINLRVVSGGLVGLAGVILLFYNEMETFSLADQAVQGFLLAAAATVIASLGNIVATRNSESGLSIFAVNAWGMLYGTLIMTVIAVLKGAVFNYEFTTSYTASLLYLSVEGSIVAFGAYLRLLAIIGPDRAAYSSMLFPVVALLLSTAFEAYQWSLPALAGLLLIMLGNVQVMRR